MASQSEALGAGTGGVDVPAARQQVLIDARGVYVRFGAQVVLENIDLQIVRGEIVTLVGLNGSGKTTLVRVLLGLLTPDRGQVEHAPGLRIGFSPQHVYRDTTLPITVERFLTLSGPVARSRLQELLREVGAETLLDSQIATLSGGEFHRVVLARAILREPDLLVLDEPLAGVDVASQSDLYRLIVDLRDRYQCGVLLVSHDLHVVMAATDEVVCLNQHICCKGHPHSVAQDPHFVSLFGPHVAETLAVYTHDHDHRHDMSGHAVPLEGGQVKPPSAHTGDQSGAPAAPEDH
ncbi:MAG: ATP-binding cassette domain-containing protein [Acidiferrobacterales bacterium]